MSRSKKASASGAPRLPFMIDAPSAAARKPLRPAGRSEVGTGFTVAVRDLPAEHHARQDLAVPVAGIVQFGRNSQVVSTERKRAGQGAGNG